MERRSFYNEILTEHNLRPEFKHDLPDANITMEGVNPSCGDHIWLKLKVKDGVIEDGAFVGDGCAISQASADIMLGMIIGRNSRPGDIDVNVCKKKHMTNSRNSAAAEEALKITGVRIPTLEEAMEFIDDDELVEITPKSIRMRKKILGTEARKKLASKQK